MPYGRICLSQGFFAQCCVRKRSSAPSQTKMAAHGGPCRGGCRLSMASLHWQPHPPPPLLTVGAWDRFLGIAARRWVAEPQGLAGQLLLLPCWLSTRPS